MLDKYNKNTSICPIIKNLVLEDNYKMVCWRYFGGENMTNKDYWTLEELDRMDYFDDKMIMNKQAYTEFKKGIMLERIK